MKNLLILICSLCLYILPAQEQASNWYFGDNAGLNFDTVTGAVTPLNNGSLGTVEGCTTISNPDGDLLFYTDGSTVYNANHLPMPNGFGLLGDESSTQSAIVVPKPNDPEIYYIFTVGSNQNPVGLHYSEVNMTLDGGLGGITNIKNRNLLRACAEKVSAVLKDCESGTIWVISLSDATGNSTNAMNSFHAFEVNDMGVSDTAIVSTLGINIQDSRGNLKFSPNGDKLACANSGSGLFIADFDPQTGLTSNAIGLSINGTSPNPYGVEFSPNGELLYVTASNDFFSGGAEDEDPASHSSVLVQYDLNAQNIPTSQIVLDDRQLYRGGLQLGPNGKIYRALSFTYDQGSSFLGVINDPNTLGLGSNYQHDAIALGGRLSRQGLPPFIQSFFAEKIDIIQDGTNTLNLALCEGETYILSAEDIIDATYTWSKDGVTLPETDFDLEISESGNYQVLIEITNGECGFIEGQAIVTYSDNPVAFDANLIQCDEDDVLDGFTLFNLTEADDDLTGGVPGLSTQFYFSQNEAENDMNVIPNVTSYNNISNPEILFVRVTNDDTGCVDYSILTLSVSATQIDDYIAPVVCDEAASADGLNTFNLDDFSIEIRLLNGLANAIEINYFETLNDALLEQNQLPSNYENTIPYSQTIYVRAENDNACYGISEVILTIKPIPEFDEDNTLYYCLNRFPELITLESGLIVEPGNNYSYLWSTGETTPTIQVNEIGTYTIEVSFLSGCSSTNTVLVEPSNIATIDTISILDGSIENNTVTVFASGEGNYVYALFNEEGLAIYPYQESNTFNNVFPGIYTVAVKDVKNDCGILESTISVVGFPKFFTPNGDGSNDTWSVYGINNEFQPNTIIYILDRYGKLLKQISPLSKGWDGTYNGNPLPSSDYWFYVTLQDGRVFKGHFSLKR